jgi:hypothetical protein
MYRKRYELGQRHNDFDSAGSFQLGKPPKPEAKDDSATNDDSTSDEQTKKDT